MERKVADIFDISYEGSGVGRIDNKVAFVPKTLPDETVEFEVAKENNKFIVGKNAKILKKSNLRTDALCPYYDQCGGCDFQHISYEDEKKYKTMILKRELEKVGYAQDVEFIESDKRYFYRNKIKLEVKDGKLGYFKSKSHEFFEVSKCVIADERINQKIGLIEEFIKENNFQKLKKIYIKQVDEKLMVCFLFDKNNPKMQKKYQKN